MGDNGLPHDLRDPAFDTERVKFSVYEHGVQVPLVVSGPHVGQPGSVSDALVSIVDLFPTAAEIAGVDLDALEVPIDGRSLLPALADPAAPVHDAIFTEAFGGSFEEVTTRTYALRDAQYKLIVREDWFFSSLDGNAVELYDIEADPDEATDLAEDPAYAAELERLQDLADALLEDFAAERNG